MFVQSRIIKSYYTILSLFLSVLFMNSFVFAGNTGKISGTVVDNANGEGLPGVNIAIEGTYLGSSSDLNGVFNIIGIPPGTYTIKARFIGYQEVRQTHVRVVVDRTTKVDFKLSEEAIEFNEPLVVTAEREAIAMDISSSKHDIDMTELHHAPVVNFNNALNLQPGTIFQTVTSDYHEEISNELSIRGGTGVGVFVDGMNISESILSGSMTNFNLSALQATEILTGGFNAEYGNIRSGIINVVTKEGGSKFHASLDGKISNIGRKHFGPSIYDQKTAPEWLLYGYDDALFGPDGIHDPENPDCYWEKFSAADTTYHFTPEQAQEVWKYQHRSRDYGHKPDYIIDGSFGGPVYKDFASFFTSLRFEYNMFSVPLSRDHFEDLNWFGKLTVRPSPSIKISFQGNYQQNLSTTTYNTSNVSVATPEQAVFSMQYPLTKYYDGMRSIADRYRNQFGINLTHVISPKTFYDFKFSYLLRRSFVNHADQRSDATTFTIGGYNFTSLPYGGWYPDDVDDFGGRESDLGITDQTGMDFIFGNHGKERDYSREKITNIRLDYVSQVNNNNQIKTGFEINYDNMHLVTGLVSDGLLKMNTFDRDPLRTAVYAQDKIEFKKMIANVGVRLDYTKRSGTYYTDPYSVYYNFDSLQYAPAEAIDPFLLVSPRVGISHPISDKSKLFFNYGHFYDEPPVFNLYYRRERTNGQIDRIPNSNLKPQKTIAYELGFEQQFGDNYLLHFSGYYRDITNQVKTIDYYPISTGFIESYTNDNYEDIRGMETRLEKKVGNYMVGSLSYDYMIRSSGNIGNAILFESTERTPIESYREQYTQSDYNVIGNITLKTPSDFKLPFTQLKLLSDWIVNFTHEYRSGNQITYNPKNLPGIMYNLRWRAHQNTNMHLSKAFSLGAVNLEAYMEVYNLLNRKEMTPYLRSYLLPVLPSYYAYLNSLREGDQPGDYKQDYIVLPNSEDFQNQLLFLNPRRYFFGIRINL